MKNLKNKLLDLLNIVGRNLDSPLYAGKVLVECGKEIEKIVDNIPKYLLIEVVDRNISYYEFTSLEEAQGYMRICLCQAMQVETYENLEKRDDFGEKFSIDENCAWANTHEIGNCDWRIIELSSETADAQKDNAPVTSAKLLEFIGKLDEDDMWDEVVVKYPDGAIENIDRHITEEEENTQIYPRVKGELGTLIEQLRKKLTLVSSEYLNVPMQFCDCEPACANANTDRYDVVEIIKEEDRLVLVLKEES